jgi:CheY-specific phosphatase CheX
MSVPDSQDAATFARLADFIRETSRAHLAQFAKLKAAALSEINSDRPVLAHWISLILISGKQVRITFRIHFHTAAASELASGAFSAPTAQISSEQAHDFAKEFCNFCAGRIKHLLSANGYDVGISLPLTMRGFDQVFEEPSGEKYALEDRWMIVGDRETVYCSALIESANSLSITKFPNLDDTGEVSFL